MVSKCTKDEEKTENEQQKKRGNTFKKKNKLKTDKESLILRSE